MKAFELNNLLRVGAQAKVRQHLKKLSIKDRMPLLHELIPYVGDSPSNLKFFKENFSQEIGALIAADYDYDKADLLYNTAKRMK